MREIFVIHVTSCIAYDNSIKDVANNILHANKFFRREASFARLLMLSISFMIQNSYLLSE